MYFLVGIIGINTGQPITKTLSLLFLTPSKHIPLTITMEEQSSKMLSHATLQCLKKSY